jgi:hypothetical protein
MDFHVMLPGKPAAHIMTTHRGEADDTPLQLISAERLAHLERCESELAALKALSVGQP